MADRITEVRWYPAPMTVAEALQKLRLGQFNDAITGYRRRGLVSMPNVPPPAPADHPNGPPEDYDG